MPSAIREKKKEKREVRKRLKYNEDWRRGLKKRKVEKRTVEVQGGVGGVVEGVEQWCLVAHTRLHADGPGIGENIAQERPHFVEHVRLLLLK
jgi:hypothetical protein